MLDGPRGLGHDEIAYSSQASTVRRLGPVRGTRALVESFLANPEKYSLFPPPTRWLWGWIGALLGDTRLRLASAAGLAVCAMVGGQLGGSWQALVLCFTSPLLLVVGRRRLQDSAVAALVLLSVLAATRGAPWQLLCCATALLCVKEAAIFSLPAVLASHPGVTQALALAGSVPAWAALTRIVCGPSTLAVLASSAKAQRHPYTLGYQQGAPHRLLVDLAMMSPAPLLLACSAPADPQMFLACFTLVAMHALAPVRNARSIVAADILLRVMAVQVAVGVHPHAVLALCAIDLYVSWKLRAVYDPVSHELSRALGFCPR